MAWGTALIAKIINRLHQPAPEEKGPVTVDRHPGCQWVFSRCEPLRQPQAVRSGSFCKAWKRSRNTGIHYCIWPVSDRLVIGTTVKNVGFADLVRGIVLHDHHARTLLSLDPALLRKKLVVG